MRLSKQKSEALRITRSRAKASTFYYPAFFIAAFTTTAIEKRFPQYTYAIGAVTLVSAIVQGIGILKAKNLPFILGHLGMTASLGALGFMAVFGFELSWTTFFVLLLALAAAALEVPTLAPRLSLSAPAIALIVGPSMIAGFVAIDGMKGRSLSIFFSLFFVALLNQARVQRNEFLAALKTEASLRKVADVVPGR